MRSACLLGTPSPPAAGLPSQRTPSDPSHPTITREPPLLAVPARILLFQVVMECAPHRPSPEAATLLTRRTCCVLAKDAVAYWDAVAQGGP